MTKITKKELEELIVHGDGEYSSLTVYEFVIINYFIENNRELPDMFSPDTFETNDIFEHMVKVEGWNFMSYLINKIGCLLFNYNYVDFRAKLKRQMLDWWNKEGDFENIYKLIE